MEGSVRLQEWIHRLEMGAGARYLRWVLTVAAFTTFAVVYDALCFQNIRNPEAMDAGQLARNIADGKGFVTSWVRPASLGLLWERNGTNTAFLKGVHPDISNAPVYPLVLAGLLKATPAPGDLTAIKRFRVAPQDLFIALFNQALMGLGLLLVFNLALMWFDRGVAWMSVALFALNELYWRLSISGLSTILLIDLVLVLVWLLSRFEQAAREEASTGKVFAYSVAIGLTSGVATLTRYPLGWLILPILIFVGCCAARKRFSLIFVTLIAFALVVTPWVIRNVSISGWPFGTATFAVLQATQIFPADTLDRSLSIQLSGVPGYTVELFRTVLDKGTANIRDIVSSKLSGMAGSWIWGFFLAGLLLRFRNSNLSRVRWFVVGAIGLFVPVQAFIHSHSSIDSSPVNADNLLVVFSPFLIIFGVGVFFVLLESLDLPSKGVRYAILAGFATILSLPLALALLPPRPNPNAPPYYPPRIQQIARYVGSDELFMSDIPWAVAWYGQRQCAGLTLDWQNDFFQIHQQKSVNGLYVSTRTTDARFLSSWFANENEGWGSFLLQSFVRHEIPSGFPLNKSPEGLFANGELLLMDSERWATPGREAGKEKKD